MAVDAETGRDEKHLPQWLVKVVPTTVTEQIPSTEASPHDASQDYLLGLRGCLAIMSFLWVFVQTFVPAALDSSANTTGPTYQLALRKSLSVFFWNGSLISSSIIFLSARTICLPFLLEPNKLTLASSVFRRGIKLWFPTAVSLILCYIIFSKALGGAYLEDFATKTDNASMTDDLLILPSSLTNFNSIFEIFWVSHEFNEQAGNWAFPTQTLWIVSALFQQSYTVYATMVIIPFTRKTWRLYGAFVFIITAWWVYSWAWFSVSGLLIADLVINFDFKAKCQAHRTWTLAVALSCMAAGYLMQFLWVAAFPSLQNAEIEYHTGLYDTGGLYTWIDPTAPQLRADDYLVIVGFYILLESSDLLQRVFKNPFFVFLGRRSYSYFLLQSIIVYTLGIRTAMSIMGDSMDAYPKAAGVAFIASLLVVPAAGELFYWLIDKPSQKFARLAWAWIRE